MIDLPWKPDPDYHRLLNALRRRGDPSRIVFLELFADPEIMGAILEEPPSPTKKNKDRETLNRWIDQKIQFWYRLGYDAIWHGPNLTWSGLLPLEAGDSATLSRGKRTWVNEKAGSVTSWEEFERYPWPSFADVDFYPLEYAIHHLPEGMAIIAQISGILEPAMWLMGYESFALAIYDQPDLIEAIFSRLAEIYVPLAHAMVEMDRVMALWMGDDMDYKTSTMISPKHLCKYVFPIQKQIAVIAHGKGLPFLLHSCGKLDTISAEERLIELGHKRKYGLSVPDRFLQHGNDRQDGGYSNAFVNRGCLPKRYCSRLS